MTFMLVKLPSPRLQLRWTEAGEECPDDWICHYELVLPLHENDRRREFWQDGVYVGQRDEFVVSMGNTRRGSKLSGHQPCIHPYAVSEADSFYADVPYADGAHANWDSNALNNIPIYVIAPDGRCIEYKKPQSGQ